MAGGSVIGEAIVDIKANTTGFLSGITGAVGQAEKAFSGMGSSMSGTLKGAGGMMTAGVTAPILAIGAFSVESAIKVDGAMNSMIRKTGETGDAANQLKTNFKNVFTTVPEDASKVSDAMTTVHNRLGLTGKDLEGVTKQGIELARMLGTDVNTTVEGAAKAFEAWHIPTDQMNGDMDKLYTVSTKTGVPLSELTSAITKGGAVASNAGVSFDTMTATVGALGSAGIPARQGVTIVTDAITKLQAQGKDAGTELPAMFERIASGTATAADKALLGQKNFDKLSGSLKDNKNNFDSLKTAMDGSKGAIDRQAESTMTLSDKINKFKNQLMTAFEPLGKAIINVLSNVLTALQPVLNVLTMLTTAFSNLPGPIQTIIVIFGAIIAAIGPVLMIIGMLLPALELIGPILMGIGPIIMGTILPAFMAIIVPLLPIIVAVVLIGILLYLLYTRFKPFKDALDAAFKVIKEFVGLLMKGDLGGAFNVLKNALGGIVDTLKKLDWGAIGRGILNAIKSVDWGGMLTAMVTGLTGIGKSVLDLITGVDWGGLLKTILVALAMIGLDVFNFINSVDWGGLLITIAGALLGIGAQFLGWIVNQNWGGLLNTIVSALADIGSKVLDFFVHANWGALGGAIKDAIVGALGGIGGGAVDTIKHALGLQGGAIIRHRTGGVPVIVGEGKEDEVVAPLSKLGQITSLPKMASGGIVSNSGTLGSLVTTSSPKATPTVKGGDVYFQITMNEPKLTSMSEADKLGHQIGYKANDILRRAGHMRG